MLCRGRYVTSILNPRLCHSAAIHFPSPTPSMSHRGIFNKTHLLSPSQTSLPTTKRRRTASKHCAPHILHACAPHFHHPVN